MLIRERLESTYFPPSEQAIASYLLDQGLNIADKSTSQVAKETYSSKSTVVKVTQRLQFTGWNEFKQAYLAELTYLANHQSQIDWNYPFTQKDNLLQVAKILSKLKQEAIAETESLIQFKTLKQAVGLLDQADMIHIFGITNNLFISREFKYNMARIRKRVAIHDIQGEISYEAPLTLPKDCVLFISYSGETKVLVKAMEQVTANGVPTILITNMGESTMSRMASCVLKIASQERLYTKISTYANDASITYLLDLLYSGVFQLNYQANVDLRKETSRIFETTRTTPQSTIEH